MVYRTGLAGALRQGVVDFLGGEDATTGVTRAARPILLIQGFASSNRTMLPLERRLRRSLGRPVVRLDLGGDKIPLQLGDIRASAARVNTVLERLASHPEFDFADIVAHSMGGLVAAYLLKRIDCGRNIRRVVTLGTPHRGTPTAAIGVLMVGLVSRAVWQMLPGSPLIRELENTPVPDSSELHAFGAHDDYIVPGGFARAVPMPRLANRMSSDINHWEFLLSPQIAARVSAALVAPTAKPRVLVVDDDAAMRELLLDSLEETGLDVVAADNVDLALQTLDDGPVDAVVSDIRMPRKDGFELLRTANRLRAKTPIILMSSFPSRKTEEEARRAGACAFVRKPFSPNELLIPLSRALGSERLVA